MIESRKPNNTSSTTTPTTIDYTTVLKQDSFIIV